VISDMFTADRYWGLRTDTSYAWKSVLDVGARLAFGSDSPVESPNPFWGLHAAITRQRADGQPGPEGWHPEQRISLLDGLHAYTTGAAYAAGWERQIGQLAAGYMADLIVLKDDPFNLPPAAVRDILPTAVMVGGEWVMRN
jgi:predicted amidohydrolase YtcJ